MNVPASVSWPPAARRRIYLMRHGDVTYFDAQGKAYPPDSVPLTDTGRIQAESARLALANIPFDLVVTSGLLRTVETAELVLWEREIRRETEHRLREITTGRLVEWDQGNAHLVRQLFLGCLGPELKPETQFLAGETFGSCNERVLSAWSDLLARTDWRQVLIVTHGVVNRLLLAHVLGTSFEVLTRLEQDACCINLIEIDDAGRPLVRLINHTPEDPAKERLHLTTLEVLYQQYLQGRKPTAEE